MSEPLPPATPGCRRPTAAVPEPTAPPSTPTGRWRSAGRRACGGLLLILAGIAAAGQPGARLARSDDDISGWGLLRNGLRRPRRRLLQRALAAAGDRARRRPAVPARARCCGCRRARTASSGCSRWSSAWRSTAAVLVPLVDAHWKLGFFGPGFWCADRRRRPRPARQPEGAAHRPPTGLSRRRGRRARGRTAPRAPGRCRTPVSSKPRQLHLVHRGARAGRRRAASSTAAGPGRGRRR